MGALTRVYDTEENRAWWIRFPVSFAIAGAMIAALLGAILIVTAVPAPGGGLRFPSEVVRWVLAIALVGLAFGLLVRFAPAERWAKKWTNAGAGLVVTAWIVQSLVFWYMIPGANFKTAVGSLIVLLVVTSYLYVAAIVLLVAIELDELLRKDASDAERGSAEITRALFRSLWPVVSVATSTRPRSPKG
jgi:uncharacterized BrkB/YihY/UPF0761 family membrane protein